MSPYSGIALQPVMDLTDRRIIAYVGEGRPLDRDALEVVRAGFASTALQLGVPLLVPVPPSLLADPDVNLLALARAEHAAPAGIVITIEVEQPDPEISALVAGLKEQGFRIALAGMRIVDSPWQMLVGVQPSFVCLKLTPDIQLSQPVMGAALAAILALAAASGVVS